MERRPQWLPLLGSGQGVTQSKAQEVGKGWIKQGLGDQGKTCFVLLKTQWEASEEF